MSNLCSHCGDSVAIRHRKEVGDSLYHRACYEEEMPRCQRAVQDFIEYYSTDKLGNVMFLGMHVRYLYGSSNPSKNQKTDKKRKRDLKLQQLLNKVSALRNSNSGSLLIQLVGLDPEDHYTGAFDEFADVALNNLIEDGKMFNDVFKRARMNVYEALSDYFDFIVLRVAATAFLTTSDFKTKVALDNSIVHPLPYSVFKFLKEKKKYPEEFPQFLDTKWAEDMPNLEESRSVQVKWNFEGNDKPMLNEDLLKKIFNELRLKEYISTFTKHDGGGMYLFGVGEKSRVFKLKEYVSKEMDVHGVTPTDASQLAQDIVDKLKDEMLVCDFSGKLILESDIIKVDLVPFKDGTSSHTARRYVVRICARHVQGIVFYDKDGPLAYRVTSPSGEDPRETKLSLKEWFSVMTRHTEQ